MVSIVKIFPWPGFHTAQMPSQVAPDARLAAHAFMGMPLEPCREVYVQPQRYLPLHWLVEHTSTGVLPVENLKDSVSVVLPSDLSVGP